jgi:hypothetical protein
MGGARNSGRKVKGTGLGSVGLYLSPSYPLSPPLPPLFFLGTQPLIFFARRRHHRP